MPKREHFIVSFSRQICALPKVQKWLQRKVKTKTATQRICEIIAQGDAVIPTEMIRTGVVAYLYRRMSGDNPTFIILMEILCHEDMGELRMSQRNAYMAISTLLEPPGRGRRGIFIVEDDKETLSLNHSLIQKVEED